MDYDPTFLIYGPEYAQAVNEQFKVCPKCQIPFVTSPNHKHDLCIVCHGQVVSMLPERRRVQQRTQRAKKKYCLHGNE